MTNKLNEVFNIEPAAPQRMLREVQDDDYDLAMLMTMMMQTCRR